MGKVKEKKKKKHRDKKPGTQVPLSVPQVGIKIMAPKMDRLVLTQSKTQTQTHTYIIYIYIIIVTLYIDI
jgi:hypothetical protein